MFEFCNRHPRIDVIFKSFSPGLFAVMTLALLIRVFSLSSTAILGDEYMQFYFALAKRDLVSFLGAIRHNPHHMLFDSLTTWIAARFGDSPAWLRTPSLFWGLAGVWGLWRFGAGSRGRALGVIAAAALAVSNMHSEWSCRATFYAALAALAVWQSVLLLEFDDRRSIRVAYGLCGLLFLLTHPYAVFVALLHGIHLAIRRPAMLRAWASCWAWAIIGFLPWFFWSTRLALSPQALAFWADGLNVHDFLAAIPRHLSSASEVASPEGLPRAAERVLAGAGTLLWIASRWPGRERLESPALALARLFMPAGVALVIVTDYAFNMYLAPRQLIWILPFYLLEVAAGGARLYALLPGRGGLVAAAFLLAAGAFTRFSAARSESLDAVRMRGIVSSISRACQPGDVFVFDDGLTAFALLYHFDREAFIRAPSFRELPPSFKARCGAGEAFMATGEERPDSRPVWRVRGTPDNFIVEPPEGRTILSGAPDAPLAL